VGTKVSVGLLASVETSTLKSPLSELTTQSFEAAFTVIEVVA
jgi:hypothetical protein